jgi:uncharacterized membrane protein
MISIVCALYISTLPSSSDTEKDKQLKESKKSTFMIVYILFGIPIGIYFISMIQLIYNIVVNNYKI